MKNNNQLNGTTFYKFIEQQANAFNYNFETNDTEIIDTLKLLFNNDYQDRKFEYSMYQQTILKKNDDIHFQSFLSKITEKGKNRKELGRYYTPKDVIEFVIVNSIVNYYYSDFSNVVKFIR